MPLLRCPACGHHAGDTAGYRPLPFAYRHAGSVLPGGECPGCGLRGLTVQPAAHEFAALYAGSYFKGGDARCGHVGDYFAERPALLREAAALVAGVLEPARPRGLTRGGRLLELGCAAGALLEAARERGWSVQGVEYSAAAAAEAERHGIPVVLGGLADAALADASFDVAFAGDVLEHVPDPAAVLRELARVLAPGGALVLRGPMATHSLARGLGLAVTGALGRTRWLDEPPYHLWEFTPGPLRRLVEDSGLRVESFTQAKTPPARTKRRGPLEAVALDLIDTVNVAWTRATNTRGDRCTLVARRAAA
ncbi:MAG: class I SAM-dependent methyltransferase [Candidatus Eisenbacteria bacterium]